MGVLTCGLHTPVVGLTRALLEKELEAAVVLDGQGNAAGFVSQDELVRAYAQNIP